MNKQAFSMVPNSKLYEAPSHELAIYSRKRDVCIDAEPVLDPEAVRRFCQVWSEVGRAILARRSWATV